MTRMAKCPSAKTALLGSSAAVLLLGFSTPALAWQAESGPPAQATDEPTAQQAQSAAEAGAESAGQREIIVTGSRISRAGFDTLQPAIVVGSEQIEQRAATNVADILNEQPAFGYPGASPVSLQMQSTGGGATVSAGQNFVNLFGLGSQRTLTLVNGKRFVSSNTPALEGPTSPGVQVDINSIPAALVDRVETIAVGGAPIYGSDAIAGTVNIILKRDFEGLEINGLAGIAGREDAERYRVQAIYGLNFADGRGNVVFNAEYNRQNPLIQSERKSTALQEAFVTPADPNYPFSQQYITDARIGNLNLNGLPLYSRTGATAGPSGLRNANGERIRFDVTGNLVPYDIGEPTGVPTTRIGGDGMNLASMQTLITKTERYLGNIFFNYDLGGNTNFHAEAWYSRTNALEPVNQPIHAAVGFRTPDETDTFIRNGVIPVRLDNPFLTPEAVAILEVAIDRNNNGQPDLVLDVNGDGVKDTPGFYLARPLFDLLGKYPTKTRQTMYRGLIGLDGILKLGGRDFRWDVGYTYGKATGKAENPAIILANYNQALDAIDDGNGNIVCRNPANGCAPLNLFGYGAPSEAAKDFVTDLAKARSKNTQHDLTANISGSLADLPGGELGVAAGIEYRRETAKFTANDLATSGDALALLFNPVSGKFHTKEIYAETVIPLVGQGMEVPLIHELEIEGAARYVDHSVAGGDLTWTAGGRYSPVRGLTFRGNFTRSIRSPAIGELFLPTVNSRSTAADPCDSRFVDQATPRRAQNCASEGIPANFNSNISNALQPITLEGNEDLKNEKANSWTIGAVLKPAFIPRLSLAVDWVDIYIKDAIFNLSPTLVLQGCYDSADYPSNEFCSLFTRDAANHQITSMNTKYFNFGFLDFSGLTAELAYKVPLGRAGELDLSANYFYLNKSNFSISGSDLTEVAGTVGASKHNANAFINWRKGGFNWFWNVIYISDAVFSNADTEFTRDIKGVDDWWMFHTGIAFEVNDRLKLQLNVDNVFDLSPPKYSIQAHGGGGIPGISTYYSGVIGRYFTASARVRL